MPQDLTISANTKRYLTEYQRILSELRGAVEGASFSADFSENAIARMIPINEAVIALSEELLRYTTNVALQTLAEGIVADATDELEELRRVRSGCGACGCGRGLSRYITRTQNTTDTMFLALESAESSASIDLNYIRELLPTLQGGVGISRGALGYPLYRGLSTVLSRIIARSNRNISALNSITIADGC